MFFPNLGLIATTKEIIRRKREQIDFNTSLSQIDLRSLPVGILASKEGGRNRTVACEARQ